MSWNQVLGVSLTVNGSDERIYGQNLEMTKQKQILCIWTWVIQKIEDWDLEGWRHKKAFVSYETYIRSATNLIQTV